MKTSILNALVIYKMCIHITTLTIFMELFSMSTRIIILFFFFYNLEIHDKVNLILPACFVGVYSISVFTTVYGILKSKPFFLIPFLSLEISNFLMHFTIFIYSAINLKFYNFLSILLTKNNDFWIFYIYVITSIFILFFELYIINIGIYCYRYLLTKNIVQKDVIINDPPPPYHYAIA